MMSRPVLKFARQPVPTTASRSAAFSEILAEASLVVEDDRFELATDEEE